MFRSFSVRLSKRLCTPDGTAVVISCRVGAAWADAATVEDLESIAHCALTLCSQAISEQLDRQLAAGRKPTTSENPNSHSAAEVLVLVREFVSRMKDFDEERLARLVQRMFHRPLDQLSRLEAQCLLNTLEAIESRGMDPDSIVEPDFS